MRLRTTCWGANASSLCQSQWGSIGAQYNEQLTLNLTSTVAQKLASWNMQGWNRLLCLYLRYFQVSNCCLYIWPKENALTCIYKFLPTVSFYNCNIRGHKKTFKISFYSLAATTNHYFLLRSPGTWWPHVSEQMLWNGTLQSFESKHKIISSHFELPSGLLYWPLVPLVWVALLKPHCMCISLRI